MTLQRAAMPWLLAVGTIGLGSALAQQTNPTAPSKPGATAPTPAKAAAIPAPAPIKPAATPAPAVASGPNCTDASVTKALKDLGRGSAADSASNGLCNTNRYRGGRWTNQPELTDLVRQSFLCEHPWIGQVYAEAAFGHAKPQGSGSSGECDARKYGGGNWSGFDDLRTKIRAYKIAAAAPVPAPKAVAVIPPPATKPAAVVAPAVVSASAAAPKPAAPVAKPTITVTGLAPGGTIEKGAILDIRVNDVYIAGGAVISLPEERIFIVEGASGEAKAGGFPVAFSRKRTTAAGSGFKRDTTGGVGELSAFYTVPMAPGTYRVVYSQDGPYAAQQGKYYSDPFRVIAASPPPSLANAETRSAVAAARSLVSFTHSFQTEALRDPAIRTLLDPAGILAESLTLSEAALALLTKINSALSDSAKFSDLGLTREQVAQIQDEFNGGLAQLLEREHRQLLDAARHLRPEAVVDVTPYRDRSLAFLNMENPSVSLALPARQLKVNWDKVTPAEKVVLAIQMSRVLHLSLEFAKEFDANLDRLLENVARALDVAGDLGQVLKKGPVGEPPRKVGDAAKDGNGAGKTGGASSARALRALRQIEYLSIGIKSVKLVLQVSFAVWPSEVSGFYVDIANKKRKEGEPPVAIDVGLPTDFSVFLIPQSPGWQKKFTRQMVIDEAMSAVLKHFPAAGKIPDEKAGERRVALYNDAMEDLKKSYPKLEKWLDRNYEMKIIKPQQYAAFELNDARLVMVKVKAGRSADLIGFDARLRKPGDNGAYRITGKSATKGTEQAGYTFELRDDVAVLEGFQTLRQIVVASRIQPMGEGVVTVRDASRPPASNEAVSCTIPVGGGKTARGVISSFDGKCHAL